MGEVSGYTTIAGVVRNVLSDQEMAVESNWKRYSQWVIRGYKKLRLFTLPLDKAVPLQVQSGVRCVIVPQDFTGFTAIGKNYNNHFHKFTLKPTLMPTVNYICGIEQQEQMKPITIEGHTYADGGGENLWYYKEDYANNRILIDGAPLTEAVLIYKSTGVFTDRTTFIPKVAEEALIAFIHWQEALNKKDKTRADIAEVQIRENNWKTEVLDIELSSLRLDDLMDAVYSTIYQGVKR
jgi:hypothetical protein